MTNYSNISFEEGFSPENDIFGRKNLYQQMMRVIKSSSEENLVIALDDDWGNGKTSFVKMLEHEIKKSEDNIDVIYFDAFENDYQTDAFVSLTSHIYKIIESDKDIPKTLKENFLKYSKKVGASIITGGTNYLISVATGGILNGTMLENAVDKVSESFSSPLEDIISKKIQSLDEEKGTLIHLKNTLAEIHNETQKKHIFIIDELDRARPDFSLSLLEKIKHIFSTEGWVFLLVLSRDQFQKSIEQQYGSINSRVYLNKFIHYWFELPKTNILDEKVKKGYTTTTIEKFFLHLDKEENLFSINGALIKTLTLLLGANNCSLREVERCYSLLSVLLNIGKVNNFFPHYQSAIALCAFLKIHDNGLLNAIHTKNYTFENITKLLNINSSQHLNEWHDDLFKLLEINLLSREQYLAGVEEGKYPRSPYGRYLNPLETIPKEINMFSLSAS